MDERTCQYYAAQAGSVCNRYESIDSPLQSLLSHVIDSSATVLDIGCGSGREMQLLLDNGCDIYGVETGQEMADAALAHHPELHGRIWTGSLPDDLEALGTRKFNVILLSAVIMHIPDAEMFSSACTLRRLISENGKVIISHAAERSGLDAENRDAAGRLFHIRSSHQIELLLGSLGFVLEHTFIGNDSLGREDIVWETLVFSFSSGNQSKSIDRIETIINNDRKTASYKIALLRALCDIARKESHLATWNREGNVAIPLQRIADLWIEYYLPLVGYREFVPQNRGETPHSSKPIAFRRLMNKLTSIYPSSPQGLAQYIADRDRNHFTPAIQRLYRELIRCIMRTIIAGPVTYTSGQVFTYSSTAASVLCNGAVWRELVMLGHWIETNLIMKWAELIGTFSRSAAPFPVETALELLLMRPETSRWINPARTILTGNGTLQCVWSGKRITTGSMHIDHAIPFSLRHDNSLWNLFPTDKRVNRSKRDLLPAYRLLLRQKELIIEYWQLFHGHEKALFENESNRFLGTKSFPRQWEGQMFSTFVESIEYTASRRGIARWEV